MKLHMTSLILSLMLMLAAALSHLCVPCNAMLSNFGFVEVASVQVNCTSAEESVYSLVIAQPQNSSLVHFPSGIDMNNQSLANLTWIILVFASNSSTLIYQFNTTDAATAETIADGETPSIGITFQTAFNWSSTVDGGGNTNVTYSGLGKQNLTQYTEGVMSQCLASDLGGFSLTFLPMSQEPNASATVLAMKNSGSFNWTYSMGTYYTTSFSTGAGDHLVDVLSLLKVDSIAPSPYASFGGSYISSIVLDIVSNTTESFISCEPADTPDLLLRGWHIVTPLPPAVLVASLSFGNNSSPISLLTFTFGGTVVPEFTASTLLATLALALSTIVVVPLIERNKPSRKF